MDRNGATEAPPSRGLCRDCKQPVPARYVVDAEHVYLERLCQDHGPSRALVAESASWYRETAGPEGGEQGRGARGAAPCRLPVLSITNACDLRCPICFTYNRTDKMYFMSPEEFGRHVEFVVEQTGGVDLINITGGEPTRHPRLFDLLERARHPRIGRITLNSNGLTLARDAGMARRLAELGVYVVMSLDTLDPEVSRRLHGRDIVREKLAALENLGRHGVQTTLLMVLVGGVNEGELGAMLDLALKHDFVRSWTIQTMTYTGQGGGDFQPRLHIPVDGVERRIEEASGGRIRRSDFLPLPSAHPLCYGVCYLLTDGSGSAHSFLDVIDRASLSRHLAGGYLVQPSGELEQEIKRTIDRLWSGGENPALLATLREMLRRVYPRGETTSVHERQRRAERMVKTIYVHAHMDEDTYDAARAARCPDQVPVFAEKFVGACDYNLFHRQHDDRFWV